MHAKTQACTSVGSKDRIETNGQTHGRTDGQTGMLSTAWRSRLTRSVTNIALLPYRDTVSRCRIFNSFAAGVNYSRPHSLAAVGVYMRRIYALYVGGT